MEELEFDLNWEVISFARVGKYLGCLLEIKEYTRYFPNQEIFAIRKTGNQIGEVVKIHHALKNKNGKIEYISQLPYKRESVYGGIYEKLSSFSIRTEKIIEHFVLPAYVFSKNSDTAYLREREFYINGILYDIKDRAKLLEVFEPYLCANGEKFTIIDYIKNPDISNVKTGAPLVWNDLISIREKEKKRLGLEFFNINR